MKRKMKASCAVVLTVLLLVLSGCAQPTENIIDDVNSTTEKITATDKPSTLEGLSETTGESTARVTNTETSTNKTTQQAAVTTKPSQTTVSKIENVDEIISKMTLKEKIGQLFIIRPDSLDLEQTPEQINDSSVTGVTKLSENMRKTLESYPVGGIVIFGKNIKSKNQLTDFITSLKKSVSIPLFISTDEEGGKVARLANCPTLNLPKYESAASVGKSGKATDAKEMGRTIGEYLAEYGFNMDFAPVADINTNPNNPIIGNRAFSSNPKTAAKMVTSMAIGLKEKNIIPVFKHFPGHGDTAEDSHKGIAVSYKTQKEMEKCEWLTYQTLTNKYCVMVGHIATPKINGDLTPASMSHKIVTDILRGQLKFNGVVITDSLAMGAITEQYAPDRSAISAVNAGCDILLCPEEFTKAFDAVVAAVNDGRISEKRIDESVSRILELKREYGILDKI